VSFFALVALPGINKLHAVKTLDGSTPAASTTETQRRGVLRHGSWRELFHLKPMSRVLTNLFRAKLVGCAMKMLREIMDDPNVGFCGTMRVMTTLSL